MKKNIFTNSYLQVTLLLVLVVGLFLTTLAVKQNQDNRSKAQAATPATTFVDEFSTQKNIAETARVSVDTTTKQVTLTANANTLPDSSTTLFTHLGSDSEVTNPVIGSGGTPTGITYTTNNGGVVGEAAIISASGNKIAFPTTGNLKKGAIDFWISLADWKLDSNGRSSTYPYDQTILHAIDGDKQMWLLRTWNGTMRLYFTAPGGGLYSAIVPAKDFEANSWHRFTFSWNIEEDVFYITTWVDGTYKTELAVPSPQTFDVNTVFRTFKPTTIYLGSKADGTFPLKGKLDEVRITSSEYSRTNYSGKAGILTSGAFDTGVPSPVWGNIKWNELLPAKTDIELQTSTSDDGVNWTAWFTQDKGMVTATFDDGYAGVYRDAFPIMRNYNFKGVPYIVPNDLGKTGFMTLEQVKELQNAGWEIGSHTMTHTPCPPDSELASSKQWLIDNSLGHSAFAYPGGCFNMDVINSASNHYTTARTIIYQAQTYNTKYQVYGFSANSGVNNTNTWLNRVDSKKLWGVINFHGIGDTGTPANISVADFTAIMQHLSTKNLDVVTIQEALVRLGMYTNNTGEQIKSANKRYIRYRAVLHTYDGNNTPVLSNVTIAAPSKIYKNLATTINVDGTFSHAMWPQTTNVAIDKLTMTPSAGSVTTTVDIWNTSGDFSKKWKAIGSLASITVNHTVGDLQPGTTYAVKKNGTQLNTFQANAAGQITFTDTIGTAEISYDVEKAPDPTATPTQAASAIPPGSLVAFWKAENNANDVIYGNNGSLLNNASFTPGKSRQAFSFTSSNVAQVVTIPYSPLFDLNSEMTIEAWINPSMIDPTKSVSKSPYGTIVAKSISPNRNFGIYLYRGGVIHLSYIDSKANIYLDTPINSIAPNTWQHVAATIKWGQGGSMKIYVNGILKASREVSTFPRPSTNIPITIGNEGGRMPFPGMIDEVQLYRRALDASEI